MQLPDPGPAARLRSAALAARIREEIERRGGWLRFDRYMEMALYEPGLGYYAAGPVEIGAHGDFTTAAERGTLLPRAIAALCERVLAAAEPRVILELGAGSGALAANLLDFLAERGAGGIEYLIVEPSASLRAQQQARLGAHAHAVKWLERLPSAPVAGLILANEVADALPCLPFTKSSRGARPFGVTVQAGALCGRVGAADDELGRAVAKLEARLAAPFPPGYRSEICLVLGAWIATLADALERGALLLIDYGLPRRELYHADRSTGTLICHYRHRAHGDPFVLPGLQDISAWVDFSACADAAAAAGLSVAGFTTQAQFLLETAATTTVGLDAAGAAERNAMKRLLLPGEMGERFKVLLLARGIECGLPGRDLRSRL